jgi:DNA polymerase III subunit epsilon
VSAVSRRVRLLGDAERFEDAALHRDRLAAFVRAAARTQRLSALTGCTELVGARPTDDLGWEIVVVRHGRLAGAAVASRGTDPRSVADALLATAEIVSPTHGPTPAASAEESECVLRWLEQPGLRLISLSGTWASPAYGAGGVRFWADAADDARDALAGWGGFGERRDIRTVHQPAAAITRIAG